MTADLKTGTSLTPGIQASGAVDTGVTVTISGSPTGGTVGIAVTAGGSTQTASPAYNATGATVQSALQALSNVGSGNLLVSGSAGGPWTVTAPAAFSCAVAVTSSLTGGTTPSVAVAEIPKDVLTVSGGNASAAALIVKSARLINRDQYSAATTTVWVTPSGQSRDASRIVLPFYSLAAKDTTPLEEIVAAMLEGTAKVTVGAGATINAVNYLITGAVSS